jgi:hypothetical protein
VEGAHEHAYNKSRSWRVITKHELVGVVCSVYLAATAEGGGRPLRRNNSNESFSSLSLAIKAMTRFGPSSYGNLQVCALLSAAPALYSSPQSAPQRVQSVARPALVAQQPASSS